jgi:hypothetical protein
MSDEAIFGEVNIEGEMDEHVENGRKYELGAAIFRRLSTASDEKEEESSLGCGHG